MFNNAYNHNLPFHGEGTDSVEDRESIVIHYDNDENLDGDFDSTEANSKLQNDSGFEEDFKRIGMIKIDEGNNEYEIIRKNFLRAMGIHAKNSNIVSVHQNSVADPLMKARREAFKFSAQATAEKCGGDPNICLAWYIGSTEEICRIFSYGFSCSSETRKGEAHGIGIHLFPVKYPLDNSFSSINSSIRNDNGVSHMILCRVIMGKTELIPVGSNQIQPSSREYDSGVDSLTAPRRLTVWSAFMNSHIFPTFVISYKPPSSNGSSQVGTLRPNSPWMSFPELMKMLSHRLEPSTMALILKFYDEFRNNKISRQKMVQRLRQVSGDRLLTEIIKSCRQKVLSRQSSVATRNRHPRSLKQQ